MAVDGVVRGEIAAGLVVLLGVGEGDADADAERLAGKIARLRIFEDEDGRFDRSLRRRGRRRPGREPVHAARREQTPEGNSARASPRAAPAEVAEPLYERFCEALRAHGVPVETGVFGARMQVELVNDGPVTIVLDV